MAAVAPRMAVWCLVQRGGGDRQGRGGFRAPSGPAIHSRQNQRRTAAVRQGRAMSQRAAPGQGQRGSAMSLTSRRIYCGDGDAIMTPHRAEAVQQLGATASTGWCRARGPRGGRIARHRARQPESRLRRPIFGKRSPTSFGLRVLAALRESVPPLPASRSNRAHHQAPSSACRSGGKNPLFRARPKFRPKLNTFAMGWILWRSSSVPPSALPTFSPCSDACSDRRRDPRGAVVARY